MKITLAMQNYLNTTSEEMPTIVELQELHLMLNMNGGHTLFAFKLIVQVVLDLYPVIYKRIMQQLGSGS